MSLRELPPDQSVNRSRWRKVRYVPLSLLVIVAILAAAVGFIISRTPPPAVTEVADPAPVVQRLPEVCQPPIPSPASEPWQGEASTVSEQTWVDHADEMTEAYIAGQDGYVFWGDIQAANLSQAIGRRSLSPEELQQWRTYIQELDANLSAEGVELYVVVTPAKWDVYPEELPGWAGEIKGSGPLDQLMAAGVDLPLIDLRAQLRTAAVENPVYSRVNSHWTEYGAYVGWNAITKCIVANQPELDSLQPLPITGVSVGEDQNEFANYGIVNPQPDWTVPEFASPLLPFTRTSAREASVVEPGFTRTELDDLPAETVTEGAQSGESVLVVRDSFGSSLSVYFQQAFEKTNQVRHNFDGDRNQQPDVMTLANAYKPDMIILQIAQRHLNFPPGP
jgi:SGNH hydrolase-like domain, acetyltransferase AlgX